MTTLRILLAGPDAIERGVPWSHRDDAGIEIATGHGALGEWPRADTIEVVIAASQVRLASVALPPVPPARVAAAAAFALEDQLAGPADDLMLAASRQRADGRVVVVIVARALLAAVQARMVRPSMQARVVCVVAEPELATPGAGWCWCIPVDRDAGSGFVRLSDGSAFPIDPAHADGALPTQLALALTAAARNGSSPPHVRVDANLADDLLQRWQRETGVPFVRGAPWQWHAVTAAATAGAVNLLQGEFALSAGQPAGLRFRSFAPALWLVGAALAIHVAATAGEWGWWRVDAWRTAQAWTPLAIASGTSPADAATPAAARVAIARRFADLRHAAGLPAPNDALPLLARAAPALAAIPPGALKSATYADGHWTLDLKQTDPALVGELDARLRRAGTPAITATTPAGTRLRFGGF